MKVELGTILIDPETDFHGMVTRRMQRMDGKGKQYWKVGVGTPTHLNGNLPARWYRESRLRVVGPFAVVYPKAAPVAVMSEHSFDGAPGRFGAQDEASR